MRTSRLSTLLFLSVFALSFVFLAGCGGGGQSGQGGQGDGAAGEKQGDRAANKNAPEVKIAIGRVMSVEPDRNVIIVKAAQGEQDAERMVFKLRKKNAQVEIDGQKAELADAKEGQQAQIEYVVRNERNRARVVTLFAAGGGGEGEPAGGGENTG